MIKVRMGCSHPVWTYPSLVCSTLAAMTEDCTEKGDGGLKSGDVGRPLWNCVSIGRKPVGFSRSWIGDDGRDDVGEDGRECIKILILSCISDIGFKSLGCDCFEEEPMIFCCCPSFHS